MKIREFHTKHRINDRQNKIVGEEIFMAPKFDLTLLPNNGGIMVQWQVSGKDNLLVVPMENIKSYSLEDSQVLLDRLKAPQAAEKQSGINPGLKAYHAKKKAEKALAALGGENQ